MRRLTMKAAALAMTAIATLGLASCGSQETLPQSAETSSEAATEETAEKEGPLEKYVELEKEALPGLKEQTKKIYSDILIEAESPSTVHFKYIHLEQQDAKEFGAKLDESAAELQDTVTTKVAPAMRSLGVKDPQVTYSYLNPDGTEIWSKTFKSE